MEFTQEQLAYIFNAVASHTNRVKACFDNARDYMATDHEAVFHLKDRLFAMLEDLEFGTGILQETNEVLNSEGDYEEKREDLKSNMKSIYSLKQALERIASEIDKDEDE